MSVRKVRRSPRVTHYKLDLVTIAFDSRDGSKDRKMPRANAQKMYQQGFLGIDLTNSIKDTVYNPIEGFENIVRKECMK